MHAVSALIVQDYVCSAFGAHKLMSIAWSAHHYPVQCGLAMMACMDLKGILPFATVLFLTGHAVSGVVNIGSGGSVQLYSENRARSELGSATGGFCIMVMPMAYSSGTLG